MNRAYSILNIKALDDEQRELSGLATTPETDRVGDILESEGAKFASEIPLLWQHDHAKPVGTAKLGDPEQGGLPYTAQIASVEEPGSLKELVDLAWQSVKAKLVRGVSIGFNPLSWEPMKNGAIRLKEFEIFELSLVTVPANASATIQNIKAFDGRLNADLSQGIQLIQRPAEPTTTKSGAIRLISANKAVRGTSA